MAINLNSIKALFGKLVGKVAPYADNVAKGVANYGDDVAKIATNYGDDVGRAVGSVDDALPFEFTNRFGQTVSADYNKPGLWNIDSDTFHDRLEGDLLTNQAVLKEELLNKRTGREYLNAIPREGSDVKFLGDAVRHFDYNNREMFKRGPVTINLPGWMPSEDLVFDRNTTLRPHLNTALGRWYTQAMKKQGPLTYKVDSRLSPWKDLTNIRLDDELPF